MLADIILLLTVWLLYFWSALRYTVAWSGLRRPRSSVGGTIVGVQVIDDGVRAVGGHV